MNKNSPKKRAPRKEPDPLNELATLLLETFQNQNMDILDAYGQYTHDLKARIQFTKDFTTRFKRGFKALQRKCKT